MVVEVKDYLTSENERNKRGAEVFVTLLEKAFGKQKLRLAEMVGHHISFEFDGDIKTMNEIPSADTLLFDHYIMHMVFGGDAPMVMRRLALVPAEGREALVVSLMKELGV